MSIDTLDRGARLAFAWSFVPAIYKRLLDQLARGECTRAELMATAHCSSQALDRALRVLRQASPRLVRVSGWHRPEKGVPVPRYGLGEAEDAPPPAKLPAKIRNRRWRSRGGDSHRSEKLRRRVADPLLDILSGSPLNVS